MTIDVRHQTVYLKPIVGLDILKTSNFWPLEKNVEKVLLDYIQQVWKELLVEFRRCEKYGLYSMVDSTGAPTVIVTVRIASSRIRNDSLMIPLEIKTWIKSSKRSFAFSVDACGVGIKDSTAETNSLYYLGAAFADYKRSFPYQKAVSSFYIKGN